MCGLVNGGLVALKEASVGKVRLVVVVVEGVLVTVE